jgi:hypothetical protein
MKRVSYAGESFLTTDTVADALVDLTAALGRTKNAEVVEVPAVDLEGKMQAVRLVVGPASQIVTIHVESLYGEPEVGDAVTRLRAQAQATDRPNVAVTSSPRGAIFDVDELDSP